VDRRAFVSAVALALLAAPLIARAQQAGKIPRIGLLWPGFSAAPSPLREAFLDGLRELGYVEGRTIIIEYRYAEGKVVAATGRSAEAVKRATATIPVVMATSGDAVMQGLVASLARPGGNVTGLTVSSPELVGKQMELLLEAVPKTSRVGVLGCRLGPVGEQSWAQSQAAAQTLGVQVVSLEVRDPSGLTAAFETARKERVQAVLVLDCSIIHPSASKIVGLAAASRLPGMYPFRGYADAGGLMAYSPDVRAQFRCAAAYVDKILKGAKPGDLPVGRASGPGPARSGRARLDPPLGQALSRRGLRPLLDRETTAAQDGARLAGAHAADSRLRPLERAVPDPTLGFAGEVRPSRTPAAPAEWR
jgi:putative ABC transport system substrate-binding protein